MQAAPLSSKQYRALLSQQFLRKPNTVYPFRNNAFLKSLSPFHSDVTNKTATQTMISPAAQTKRARLERAAAAFDKFQKRINDENSSPPPPPTLPIFNKDSVGSPVPRNHEVYQHPSFGGPAVVGSFNSGEKQEMRISSSAVQSAAWAQP